MMRRETQAWCGMTLKGTSRQQKRVPKTKRSIAHDVLYWSELIPFYQRIPRIIFKICFLRSYMPSRATKQIHFRNFTCPQTCFSRTETLGECQVTPLHICQPFITNLFIFFLYQFIMIGKLSFFSILIKKHTFENI